MALLVLPECDLNGARGRLEQICGEIRRKAFVFRGQLLPRVTVSAGLAELGETLPDAEALIAAADEALYAAKRGGRDRIDAYAGEPQPAVAGHD